MENNSLMLLIIASVFAAILGGVIGFLIGRQKASASENELAGEQARSRELDKQIKQKEIEISRLNDDISRKNVRLLEAESAKTEAETRLHEAGSNIIELREQLDSKDLEIVSYRNAHAAAEKKSVEFEATNKAIVQQLAEQKKFLDEANEKLRDAFKSLSSDALETNNTAFLHLAKQQLDAKVKESAAELEMRKQAIDSMVKPLGESLSKFDEKLGEIELKREGAYSQMATLLDVMKGTTDQLNLGTKQLVSALKTSHVRGRYGEIGLRRIVEAAGMMNYCHFTEQDSVTTDDGKLRPDMTIHLPGHRELILDAKCPLASYLRAFQTEDEKEQSDCLKLHAAAVRDHLKKLGNKSYWEQFTKAPDFVIMYLEIESSYGAALMSDSELIVDALNHNIVFATPSTLIGMLRTLGFMWQQERMAESILEMRDAGLELYKRTATMLEHFSRVGSGLKTAVNSYNDTIASLESRVLTHLEKIKDIGGTLAQKEFPQLPQIDLTPRPILKTLGPANEN